MPRRVHASAWRGPALCLVLSMGLLTSGCATWLPGLYSPGDHLQFLVEAINAEPAEREALWLAAKSAPQTMGSELRLALLQSVRGHSGYNLAGAETRLQALLADDPPPSVAEVAHARLAELRQARECHNEVQSLRERIDQMVDIERNLKDNGR